MSSLSGQVNKLILLQQSTLTRELCFHINTFHARCSTFRLSSGINYVVMAEFLQRLKQSQVDLKLLNLAKVNLSKAVAAL